MSEWEETADLERLAVLLWRRVRDVDGCLEWQGFRGSRGYGQIGLPGTRRSTSTHRAAWIVTHGLIPDGLFVCHRCDNPPCCNPEHLFLGTNYENIQDAVSKGRIKASRAVGERSGNARLTDAQVAEIRLRHIKGIHPARRTGGSSTELANEFGVTKQYVTQLVSGRWRVSA